jgi:hypothetical protein
MSDNSVSRRSNTQTAIAIVLVNVLTLPASIMTLIVAALLFLVFEFGLSFYLYITSESWRLFRLGLMPQALPLHVVLSAGFVSFAYLPDVSSGWRSVLAAIAWAVVTQAAVLAICTYLSDTRMPAATRWPFGESVLFGVALYFGALIFFYLCRLFDNFVQARSQ